MNNELINFHHEMFGDIRAIEKDGEPWFVGKDVAKALGYNNTRDTLYKHVDEEDKRDGVAFRDTIGREQKMTIINESGLYYLVLPRSSLLPRSSSTGSPPRCCPPSVATELMPRHR